MTKKYDPTSASSIFAYSEGLVGHSLAEALKLIGSSIDFNQIEAKGKGSLGQLVEKYWYGYELNSSPLPDFPEAGVELKTTPLKTTSKDDFTIKERLICDMIDYCTIVNLEFQDSPFYKKCLLMLILFYLHSKDKESKDLKFLYSVLWQLKDKDLLIIKHDYEVIVNKVKLGLAHELSEGDTMYLGACRKGQKGDSPRPQPFSPIDAPRRAFSLKPAYMRTVLDFVRKNGKKMATNTDIKVAGMELVSENDLKSKSFEQILTERLMKFKGKDYRQIAHSFKMEISPDEKSKYARVTKRILLKGLRDFSDAEEIKKAGIIAKTIRVETNGGIKESMSFENINYDELYETENWLDSRWYEIVTSRFMFIVFREDPHSKWKDEKRYVLDNVLFWTMPSSDMDTAENYWANIKNNVMQNTLQDNNNTFWHGGDRNLFHVRPKAQTKKEKYFSPITGEEVPKKCYWFNREYVAKIINTKNEE